MVVAILALLPRGITALSPAFAGNDDTNRACDPNNIYYDKKKFTITATCWIASGKHRSSTMDLNLCYGFDSGAGSSASPTIVPEDE
jgi:hypothetical protein